MEWKSCYLDLLLIPSSLFISLSYHLWLWHKIQASPRSTVIGINSAGRRQWAVSIMEVVISYHLSYLLFLSSNLQNPILPRTTTKRTS